MPMSYEALKIALVGKDYELQPWEQICEETLEQFNDFLGIDADGSEVSISPMGIAQLSSVQTFTNSPLIDFTRLSPHRNSPRNQRITKITWHHFAGVLSVETVGQILQTRQASYNYGVGSDGRRALYVNERDRAWASSSPSNDNQAIVIGLSNSALAPNWPVSETVIDSAIEVTVDCCKRNGISQLVFDNTPNGSFTYHDMFVTTLCPGPFLRARTQEIIDRINARLQEGEDMSLINEIRKIRGLENVTEAQVAQLIGDAMRASVPTADFNAAIAAGITDGSNNRGLLVRGQGAVMCVRVLNRIMEILNRNNIR